MIARLCTWIYFGDDPGKFAISCFAIYKSYELVNANQKKIFILANDKAIEAYASDRKANVAVEAKMK